MNNLNPRPQYSQPKYTRIFVQWKYTTRFQKTDVLIAAAYDLLNRIEKEEEVMYELQRAGGQMPLRFYAADHALQHGLYPAYDEIVMELTRRRYHWSLKDGGFVRDAGKAVRS